MDVAAVLISQYQASLEMLKQTINECPEAVWYAEGVRNKFWHTAYHTLFFTHVYLADSEEAFIPWSKHRDGYADFETLEVREPVDKETILEYLAFCQQQVAERVPQLNLGEPEGFGDRSMTRLELQIYSIRHVMQHTGELMERLSTGTNTEIDWVGSMHA